MTKQSQHTAKAQPVSVRLMPEERALLEREAGGLSLSEFIRARLFGEAVTASFDFDDRLSPEVRQKMLAQILAKLGESDAGKPLAELAELARLGLLQMSTEEQLILKTAISDLHELRLDLIKALGMRPKKGCPE
jgi:hypothetical protein